jgi:chromate transporter
VSDQGSETLARPASRRALFWAFTALAMQGFGGVLAVVQRDLVERKRWMTREQFVDDWAVAQILPGANVINLSLMIGDRYFGWTGAAAAVAGMLLAPLMVLLMVVVLYSTVAQTALAQGALRGMGAVAAGLIIATGMKLLSALVKNPLGLWMCTALAALTFVAVALLRWPLVWVLLGLGGVACAWAYRLLSQSDENAT